ncbi:hypothetical protein [Myxosarcina sp. GI1]|uniref:hypothetical protein n=1 Tax=Myxosarcina sp. GI1 TaxID=1541065 RepID=UPI00055E79F1|nr:hypothetical protein [Myxosarcina sp. GI1]
MNLSDRDASNNFSKIMLLMEEESSQNQKNKSLRTPTREREAILALGVMAMLIVLNFFLLHRSVRIEQIQTEIEPEEELSLIDNTSN